MAGERGLVPLSLFDPGAVRASLVGEVRGLDVKDVTRASERSELSRTDAMAVLAAREAVKHARIPPGRRLGVAMGGTTGGMFETETFLSSPSLASLPPERARQLLAYPLSASLGRVVEAVGGAVVSRSICSACSGGAIALVQALAWLRSGTVDFALAGGADGLCRLTVLGFNALGAVDPLACRPFDVERAGLNLGEGAALLCLEREESAVRRGAEVLAWLDGFAVGAEAHHITHPEPSGARAGTLMREALQRAGMSVTGLSYVNAHGTGTQKNDAMEALALSDLLGESADNTYVSSCKAQLGHALGAAGAIEAAITVLALSRGAVPPTVGLRNPEFPGLRHVRGPGVRAALTSALSNSFGFGGRSCVLAFAGSDTSAPSQTLGVGNPVITFATTQNSTEVCEVAVGTGGHPESWSHSAPPEPDAELSPERSRRFDRGSAFVAAAAERALRRTSASAEGTGLILGVAFGTVDRTMAFLARARERGPRHASPAEFPHLVPSAAAGNASIYAGLRGPVFVVSDLGHSGEAALAAACDLIAVGATPCLLAGAIAPRDRIVDGVLGPLLGPPGEAFGRGEGAAFLLLEAPVTARARGARALAEVLGRYAGSVAGEPSLLGIPTPVTGQRHHVLLAAVAREVRDCLARSEWRTCEVTDVGSASGEHEALGALALATAVSMLAAPGGAPPRPDRVLVLSGGPLGYWAVLLGPAGSAAA